MTVARWDDATVLDRSSADITEVAPENDGPSDRILRRDHRTYVELLDTGWGALIGWSLGPGRLVRVPVPPRTSRSVRIIHEAPAGSLTYERPPTAEELTQDDDYVDDYLADAGVPPRPRGYEWFAPLPDGTSAGQFWSDLNTALGRFGNIRTPAEHAHAFRTIFGPPDSA